MPSAHFCWQHQPAGKAAVLQVLRAGVPHLWHTKVPLALRDRVKWPSSIVAVLCSPGHLQELVVHPQGMEKAVKGESLASRLELR